jgi:hypothetical protein
LWNATVVLSLLDDDGRRIDYLRCERGHRFARRRLHLFKPPEPPMLDDDADDLVRRAIAHRSAMDSIRREGWTRTRHIDLDDE